MCASAPVWRSTWSKSWKIAAIFPGVITDADYNTLAYEGICWLAKSNWHRTAYSESVAVPDVDRVIARIYRCWLYIIWTHGGHLWPQTADLAVPSRMLFFIAEGDVALADSPANLWFIDRNFHVGFYGIGSVAVRALQDWQNWLSGRLIAAFLLCRSTRCPTSSWRFCLDGRRNIRWAGDFNIRPKPVRLQMHSSLKAAMSLLVPEPGYVRFIRSGESLRRKVLSQPNTPIIILCSRKLHTSFIYDFTIPLKSIYDSVSSWWFRRLLQTWFWYGAFIQTPLQKVDPSVVPK